MLIIWVGKEMRLGYGLNPKRVFFLSFLYIHRSAAYVVMYLSMTQHYWNLPISPKGHINHFYNHQTQQKQQLKAQLRHFCIICINTNNQNPVLTSLCLTRQTTHCLNAEISFVTFWPKFTEPTTTEDHKCFHAWSIITWNQFYLSSRFQTKHPFETTAYFLNNSISHNPSGDCQHSVCNCREIRYSFLGLSFLSRHLTNTLGAKEVKTVWAAVFKKCLKVVDYV